MIFDCGAHLPLCLSMGHDWYLVGHGNGEVTVWADHYACTRCDATCPVEQESQDSRMEKECR